MCKFKRRGILWRIRVKTKDCGRCDCKNSTQSGKHLWITRLWCTEHGRLAGDVAVQHSRTCDAEQSYDTRCDRCGKASY